MAKTVLIVDDNDFVRQALCELFQRQADAEVIKDGKGFPKLLNDDMVIPYYLANGATLKEALDWCVSGCCENRLPNRETHCTGNGILNYGVLVEMTFRNGKLKVHKDVQFGVQTGDPRTWTSFDDVWRAFCKQLEHVGRHLLIQQYVAMQLKPRIFAASPKRFRGLSLGLGRG